MFTLYPNSYFMPGYYPSPSRNPYHGYTCTDAHPSYYRALAEERARARARAVASARSRTQAQFRPRAWYEVDDEEEDDDDPCLPGRLYGVGRDNALIDAKRRQQVAEMARRQRANDLRTVDAENIRRRQPRQIPEVTKDDEQELHEAEQSLNESERSPSTSRTHSPAPLSTACSEPLPSPSEQLSRRVDIDGAASTIQQFWRAERSLKHIQAIENRFNDIQVAFSWPTTIDFLSPTDETVISLPSNATASPGDAEAAKIAYTSNNTQLHAQVEALSRLLVELDGVESWGVKRVRDARKRVVRAIETKADDIERWWKGVWAAYVVPEATHGDVTEEEEVVAMVTDQPTVSQKEDDETAAEPMRESVEEAMLEPTSWAVSEVRESPVESETPSRAVQDEDIAPTFAPETHSLSFVSLPFSDTDNSELHDLEETDGVVVENPNQTMSEERNEAGGGAEDFVVL